MLKRFARNEKGFTLVELLAVIVILGIIAAIAIPSITGLINKTQDKAKVAEAIQIIDAAKLYVATNGVPDNALTSKELDNYLSNVDATGYAVTVKKDLDYDNNGKVTYYISKHPAVGIVVGDSSYTTGYKSAVSEQNLLDYAKNGTKADYSDVE